MIAIAIVGSRKPNERRRRQVFDFIRALPSGTVIITGDASGVDSYACDAARERSFRVVVCRAHWKRLGLDAGPERNSRVVDRCDCLVAFWDGKSPGTKDAIKKARKAGKLLKVVR